jgi:hypothetical protein
MNNAQISEGKVVKRFGSRYTGGDTANQFNSRLSYYMGDYTNPSFTDLIGFSVPTLGSMFKVESSLAGVYYYFVVITNAAGDQLMDVSYAGAGASTFNFALGGFTLTGLPADAVGKRVYYYPNRPVMGFFKTEDSSGVVDGYLAWNDRRCFYWDPVNRVWDKFGTDVAVGLLHPKVWAGDTQKFFSITQYRGSTENINSNLLFVCNNNSFESLRYFNFDTGRWYFYAPLLGVTTAFLRNARIVKFFKGRLIFLNISEAAGPSVGVPGIVINYPNKVRWSNHVKNPLDVDAFKVGIAFGGGSAEAPINEPIIAADIYKDHLIVFFSNSVWELAYTFNSNTPFIWKLINDNRGALGTNTLIDLDEAILSIDSRGIVACNGSSVQEIDQKIPNEVFSSKDALGSTSSSFRVNGIKDYKAKMCYWTFPRSSSDVNFPYTNKVLSFNYETGSWSLIDDSITCFGIFREGQSAPEKERYERIIAGNQQGFVFLPDMDIHRNCGALGIFEITVTPGVSQIIAFGCFNHNLSVDDYVLIENIIADPAGKLIDLNDRIFKVEAIGTKDSFAVLGDVGEEYETGTYICNGTISRVTPPEICTKQYGFYADKGLCTYVSKADFMVSKTTDGEFTVDTYVSTASNSLLADGIATGTLVGTNIVKTAPYPTISLEANQTRLWHPVYLQASGEVVQLKFYLTDAALRVNSQIRNTDIVHSNFTIHALLFEGSPSNRIL